MQFAPWRWLVIFFTRTIHLSDVVAFLRARRKPPVPVPVPIEASDTSGAPTVPGARRTATTERKPLVPRLPIEGPPAGIVVSEQPLDTLPGELVDEFLHASAVAEKRAAPDPGQ